MSCYQSFVVPLVAPALSTDQAAKTTASECKTPESDGDIKITKEITMKAARVNIECATC